MLSAALRDARTAHARRSRGRAHSILAAAAVAENFLVLGLALHAVQAVHTAVEYQALGTLERDWLRALRIFEIKQDLQQVVLPQMAVHHLGALARCAWRDGDGQARRQ